MLKSLETKLKGASIEKVSSISKLITNPVVLRLIDTPGTMVDRQGYKGMSLNDGQHSNTLFFYLVSDNTIPNTNITCKHTHLFTHTAYMQHTHTYSHVDIHRYMHSYTHTYTNTDTHTNISVCTHTQ